VQATAQTCWEVHSGKEKSQICRSKGVRPEVHGDADRQTLLNLQMGGFEDAFEQSHSEFFLWLVRQPVRGKC